jgi:hypothetical protein
MSPRRLVWLLAAGLAVIAFAIWLSSKRHLERATLAGDLVLPGLEQSVNAVTQIELRKGDGTHATVSKDGQGWNVGERGWPADVSRVRKLLLDLGALNVVEEKTRVPANYAQLGVEDIASPKASGVHIAVAAPVRSWALIVGKASGAKSGYVRVANKPQSLLAAPLLTVDADPKTWLEHALVDVGAERVREVEEKPASGARFSLSRDSKEQTDFTVRPLPRGRELSSPGAADSIAGALSALRLDDAHKAPGAPDPHSAHAVYRTFDGLELDVAGRKDGSRPLVMISARAAAAGKEAQAEAGKLNARCGGWEFDIPDYKYNAIFTPLEDLLKKPEPLKKKKSARAAAAPAPAPK